MRQHTGVPFAAGVVAAGLLAFVSTSPASADGEGSAKPAEPQRHYRWGAGWDDGLALRARLGGGWGLGLRVDPDLLDPESSGTSSSDDGPYWPCTASDVASGLCVSRQYRQSTQSSSSDVHVFSASLMGYHERKLGKYLGVGPYLALNYERRRNTLTETYDSQTHGPVYYGRLPEPDSTWKSTTTTKRWERTLGVELGVRPTFRFHDRFVLESRFGFEWAHTKWNEAAHTSTESKGGGVIYPLEDNVETASAPDIVAPLPAGTSTSESASESKGTQRRLHTVGERLGPGATLRFIVLF